MRGDSGYAYLPAGQAEVEFGKYEQRIRQLEKQCEVLSAEVDRCRPVVEAAQAFDRTLGDKNDRLTMQQRLDRMVKLKEAVADYRTKCT